MNRKSSLLLIVLLFFWGETYAQLPHFNWAKQVSSEIQVNSMVTDSMGNLYSTGIFSGSPDFDPNSGVLILTDSGFGDIFISKTDPTGNLLWAKRIGGTSYDEGRSISIDANGNCYVAGFFNLDSIDFDPGVNTFLMNSLTGENSFVLKLDSNGNFVWAKQIESAFENYARSLTLDKQNNILVTGRFEGTADFDPSASIENLSAIANAIYILKLDVNGNFIWAKQIETILTRSHSVATDQIGNVYLAGLLVETNDFDPSASVYNLTNTSTSGHSLFMLKLNALGDFLWAKQIDNVDMIQNDRSVVVDSVGNSYYGGYIVSTTDFDPNIGVHTVIPTTGNDYFLLKFDNDGNFSWVNQLSDVEGITMDNKSNIYTCGSNIQKFNGSGFSQWSSQNSLSSILAVSLEGDIYTSGNFSGTFDFDPDSTTFNLTSGTSGSTFIQKLSPSILSGFNEINQIENIGRVFPNPSNGVFQIQGAEIGEYVLYNSLGSIVLSFLVENSHLSKVEASLPNGVYFLQKRGSVPNCKKNVIGN